MSEPKIERLTEKLLETIDEFTDDCPMMTGEVMTALFILFVSSAVNSPQYDPQRLVAETNEKIRAAVGLQ